MICTALQDYWTMCQTMRHSVNPEMRKLAIRYFAAKKVTLLSSDLETKAVSKVDDLNLATRYSNTGHL